MKARPIAPVMIAPFRVETSPGNHITWYPDGFIKKVYSNGNVEEWVPCMCVTQKYMHQTVLPSGASHTTYYTDVDETFITEGEIINWHLIDTEDDGTAMCWENECGCINDARIYKSHCEVEGKHVGDYDNCEECADELSRFNEYEESKSRCETVGKHVGCPYCHVCGPEVEDERKESYYDELDELTGY